MFVRKVSTYENAKNEVRVLVTFQSVPVSTGAAAMFATKLPAGAKIGSMVLNKGISLEEAKKSIPLGTDFSEHFQFGALVEGQLYEVEPKAVA